MKWPYQKILIIFTILFLTSANSLSQIDNLQFERISIESGLSQSTVLCIYQDQKGFLWFGTYEGLNRYDGYNFKIYKYDPENMYSISNNSVEFITEDHLGNLWIATQDGLNRFDRCTEQFKAYKHDTENDNSISKNYIRYIFEDKSGTLWIGTHGGGLEKFDREKEKFIHYRNDPKNPNSLSHNNVLCILEDRQGKLWIGTDGGLNYFDREKGEFVRYNYDPDDLNSIGHDGIWRLHEDQKGNLWMCTWGGGISLLKTRENRFFRFQHNSNNPDGLNDNIIRSVYEDKNGNIWFGTEVGGLNIYNPDLQNSGKTKFLHTKTDQANPYSLSSNSILSMYEDKSGIVWIGTNFGGINKYNLNKRKFAHYKIQPGKSNSLNNNSILSVYEAHDGTIWLGTNGGGLNCFDRENNKFTHYTFNPSDERSLSNNVVRSITEDKYNRLWIATDYGLNRYDPENDNFIRYIQNTNDPNSVGYTNIWNLMCDKDGNLWIGMVEGLDRFDYETETFIHYKEDINNPNSLSNHFIWDIYQDSTGTFWIGTNSGGLNKFNLVNESFKSYQHDPLDSNTICNDKVLCVYGNNGELWLGTTTGLNLFDIKTESFKRYSERDGLPSDVIQSIIKDDTGNLWLGTTNGLCKFNPKTKEIKNFYENNGLQSNEFNVNACTKLKSGELIFGGINGFNLFYPDSIKYDLEKPAVTITDFKLFNKEVKVGQKFHGNTILKKAVSEIDDLTLSYKDNVFSFEFAALHYASPENNLYAYKMEGFDIDWNYTNADRRFANYTNLPGGDYTFRVIASNNDQVWNDEGVAIAITITPPFWETTWFRILALLIIISSIYIFYKYRIRSIEAHRKELEMKVKERTQQLSEKAEALIEAKKETDNILENVKEGFFLLDKNFQISSQYSSILETIFCKKKLAQLNIVKFLIDKIPADEVENTKNYLELMFDYNIDDTQIADLNPLIDTEFSFKEKDFIIKKYLKFTFRRIKSKNSKKIELIVTVRDVTEQILLSQQLKEEEARREKLLQLMLSILDVEPKMLSDFSESANRELSFIDSIMNHEDINNYHNLLVKVQRSIHLVKGNARLLNIDFFAEQAHQFEDHVSDLLKTKEIKEKDIEPLRKRLLEIQNGMTEMESIIEKIGKVLTHKDKTKRTDAGMLLKSLENLINSFSTDLGKKIKFKYKNFKRDIIPERYHLLIKEVLIQLVRNSISHGIETPEERLKLKKPEYGVIEISTFTHNGSIGLKFRDDGRGLQLEKLKQRAIESGKWLPEEVEKWDKQKLANLIFASGITTSDKVDMVSGRGVGMDGVKHRLVEHDGQIMVNFDQDKYCEFEILLPSAA
jgi:ligand-binding sensor domain-containing protein/signal transduction histidine kinase